MKQILEFDTSMQPAETTYNELAVTINAYKIAQGINSLQIHRVAAKISKALREAFLTWGGDDMTAAQMTALTAILQSQYGLVGYTNPAGDPYGLWGIGLDETAGIATNPALEASDHGQQLYKALVVQASHLDALTPSGWEWNIGQVYNSGTGNEYWPGSAYDWASDTEMMGTLLNFVVAYMDWVPLPSDVVFTVPKATVITVKNGAGTSLVLPSRANDLVVTLAAGTLPGWGGTEFKAWLDTAGNLYLAQRYGDKVLPNVDFVPFITAAQGSRL